MNQGIAFQDRNEIQGLVASGFTRQKASKYLPFSIQGVGAAKEWLASLVPRLTSCNDHGARAQRCIALTSGGLEKLGLPKETISGFSPEFCEGMVTAHRGRILGDWDASQSDPNLWRWGGPQTAPIDGVLLLYAGDQSACRELVAREMAALRGVKVEHFLSTIALAGRREHFGFRDGLTHPFVKDIHPGRGDTDALPAGEVLLGYPDVYGVVSATPTVSRAAAPELPPSTTDPQRADFGRNASYIVFRQLEQDIQLFWKNIADAAMAAGFDPKEKVVEIASRMMGRSPEGVPLSTFPDGRITYANDPRGLACPLGAHVRRANPRDGLLGDATQSLRIVNSHRILRRGRPYGAPAPAEWYPPGLAVKTEDGTNEGDDAGQGRGMHFICLCGDIARQFEFIQQSWLQNRKFSGLFDETDPVSSTIESSGQFTIPRLPLRARLSGISPAVRTVGGAYFVLLSRAALRYLASS